MTIEKPEKPKYPFNKELKHRNTRRAAFCNYLEPGFFMITITSAPGIPAFSAISGTPEAPIVSYSRLGAVIRDKIESIPSYTPQLNVIEYVVMPDHIHILLEIAIRLPRHLGKVIGGFMGGCTVGARKSGIITDNASVFEKNYHDRAMTKIGQIGCVRNYIRDNPRRLLIKRLHPDFFQRHIHLNIAGREYAAYGNIFLLRHDYLMPVRIHRRWSKREFEAYEDECLSEIAKGAIAVSPFIHPAEKAIRTKALNMGASVIHLRHEGFEARFKPKGEDFTLCAAGRLLLLAAWPGNTVCRVAAGYAEFHSMNDMANNIASLTSDCRMHIVDFYKKA